MRENVHDKFELMCEQKCMHIHLSPNDHRIQFFFWVSLLK